MQRVFDSSEPLDQRIRVAHSDGMMLTNAREISEREVLLAYAHAELLEPIRNQGAAQLAANIEQLGGWSKLNAQQQQRMIDGICAIREPMLGFLLLNKTRWFDASIGVHDLASLRLTSWFEQPKYESARTIDALMRSTGASDYTFSEFRMDQMRGRIIAVAPDLRSSLLLVEGTRRCCEIVRSLRTGEIRDARLPIYVGVCRNIDEYAPFYAGTPAPKRWWVPGSPEICISALLDLSDHTKEGQLVEAVAFPWFDILQVVQASPEEAYKIGPRKWEEIIAGAYTRAGFEEVILTPRSGDNGRDVIATKRGVGSIRIFDQVKAYRPDRVVSANDARALVGVLAGAGNVSKGVITTTSTFAPQLAHDEFLAPFIPYRLELKPRDVLLPWLDDIARRKR